MSADRSRVAGLTVAVVGTAMIALATPFETLSATGHYALATAWFAASLWVTEALPLPVTALCVPVVSTVLGVYPSMTPALAGFADPVVFLLLAGFVLAAALRRHDVDRRIAYRLIARVGTSPARAVLALMAATAGLSMVVSNTATTAMMIPVALGVSRTLVTDADGDHERFRETAASDPPRSGPSNVETAALLGTAYAASIGGVGTLIGSPPNAIVVSQLATTLAYDIGFADWLAVGLPVVVVTLPVAWYVLVGWLYPPEVSATSGASGHAENELAALGPLSAAGRRTVAIAAATAALWLVGGLEFLFTPWLPTTWATTLFGGPGPSVFGVGHRGVLYFVVVGMAAIPALILAGGIEWADVEGVDWGTLLLLGGGLSLADALTETGAVAWLADVTLDPLVGLPVVVVVFLVVIGTVFAGELASNTAMAAVLVPLLIGVGPEFAGALGTGEATAVLLAVTGGVAASFGFALPVATPPNAIAFGTGQVRREEMLRAGVVLDVLLAVVVSGLLVGLFVLLGPVGG